MAGVDRLITIHKVAIINPIPLAYLSRVRALPGVKYATSQAWFGGIYQEDKNQLAALAVDVPSFFLVYNDYTLPPDQKKAFEQDRTAMIVGSAVAERFKWKIGDTVPIRSNIWTKKDGSNVWPMKIAGIYTATTGDNQSIYFHQEYLDESRTIGKNTFHMIIERLEDRNRSAEIARNIDALFANSSTETKTATESAFIQGFANQMGNIGALITGVAAAVFFTMLLVTANAMAQSVRERVREIAVMRTIGFSNGGIVALVLLEGLGITVIGGALGLWSGDAVARSIGARLTQYLPLMFMPPNAFVIGALLAVALGALSCALPCAQIWRLEIVEQLRRT
jgi:putative ABC transport system permease protein